MFRNRELRHFALLFLLTAALSITAGFLSGPVSGISALLSSTAFGILFFVFTKARYERIAQLSEQIDLVLHNAEHILIAELEEGELSVLQSELIKMTQRIREQNTALQREKERLADSLADIAHQLRTPLTSANLILSLLENEPSRSEKEELLRETKELFSHMDWLLTSLLKLSRLDAGVVEFQNSKIEMGQLVGLASRPLLFSMDLHNITLHMDIPECIFLHCDPGWLSEALRNILKNCMDSIHGNGEICVICRDTSLFTEIKIYDNGPGIPPNDLPFLFDRFYRGRNKETAGYGIGLALCRTIILRQNGTVTAKNHRQGGAEFVIRFPK